jgi:rhodanese-related sulfurtransferase
VDSITKEELKMMLDNKEDFVLINVLPKKYFDEQHISGSINIPIEDKRFDRKIMDNVPDKHKKVIVHCANTECQASPEAAKRIMEMGYTDVMDFEGGTEEFCSEFKCSPA